MIYRILYSRTKKHLEKANRKIYKKNRIIKYYEKKIAELRRNLAKVRREKSVLEDGYVVDWCIHCNRQVTMLWDIHEDGLTAFCPHCSQKMMLCNYCEGDCDYDYGIEVCKEM